MVAPTILVIEDNPTTLRMLRIALVTEGYAVIEAPDARTALAAAEKALPDLILQDLILPDMDGFELLRCLRSLPGGAELPILALSGFLSRLESAQTDEGGFTALLVKPIEPGRLLEIIRVYLPQSLESGTLVGEGRRLLVVDDDLVQLKLTRIHFTLLGFDVVTANGAAEALVAARANRPDIILSDTFMPGTDGFELCLEVRRDENLAGVPFVLVSARYGSNADKDLARRVGASSLVLRTPDFGNAVPAIFEALETNAPTAAEQPSDHLELSHARLLIHQLEQQAVTNAGLAQRCGIQAGQLSLLSGVADALTRRSDPEAALGDVLAATLDAAGISKGALILKDEAGGLIVRQDIGFSESERTGLRSFFGQSALLEEIIDRGRNVPVPSQAIPSRASREILAGANVGSVHIVPLISDGRGVGAMIIGATSIDVANDDSVAFARAMGNQIVQSLKLARTVARLSDSEQRYRTLLENANDFVAVLTPDGIIREMNRRWVEFTGLPQDQLIGRHVRDFTSSAGEHGYVAPNGEQIATIATTGPVEIFSPGGPSTFIEFSSANVDVGGEELVFTIGRDITERKRAVEKLRTAEERMRFALQNANVGIWDIDFTTGAVEWSETVEAHYGLEPGTFGGTMTAFAECIHPDDRASALATIRGAKKSGADFSMRHRSIWPDGTIRWLSGLGRVLLGEHGEPVRGLGISLDDTEHHILEQQYQQAQKMEAVGTLASGIAHDFNNILAAMLGCTQLAAMDAADNPAVLANLEHVAAAGRRATELVQQILEFSGQQEHVLQSTHLELVVREALALLRASLPSSIELRGTYDPSTPAVQADRSQVHQIVMNLGINAWHSMGGRPGVIEVMLDTVDADSELPGDRKGRYARLSVRDNGHGMNAATQARIFEPFFTTKATGQGTGLGLASVHGIMKSYDGEITVTSQVGEGTTFQLYFPAIGLGDPLEGVADGPLPRGDGQHVLFVDDEPSLVIWGTSVLERLGYRVTGLGNAVDALAAVCIDPHLFDLVLTDMTMPMMTGSELAERVGVICPDLPFILMSGYIAPTTDAFNQFGAKSILMKPIALKTLADSVDRALRESSASKEELTWQ